MSETLRNRLILEEGKKNKLYRDTSKKTGFEGRSGKVTIGVGYNIDDLGLPDDIILLLLDRSIAKAEQDLARALPWVSSLDEARREVLVDMVFNMGIETVLEFHTTLFLIQTHDFEGAASRMLQSAWADQVGDRAKRLAEIMRTGRAS